jgi:UDP-N-acetylmuramoyl-tripeptide--D-alanyl-D-alanine ligase
MKKFFRKKIVEPALRSLAFFMLKKHKPEIIAITGSVGKTSVKEAIALLLSQKFKVLTPKRSYNTEIGTPLAIFSQYVPYPVTSILGWARVLKNCIFQILFKKEYYQKLVLEMGADKPGDIKYLTSFIKPHIAVITAVVPVHLLQFKTIDDIAREKEELIKNLSSSDWAVLNYDDERVKKMGNNTSGKIIFFGLDKKADIYATHITSGLHGLTFTLNWKDKFVSVCMPNIISRYQIYTALAAAAVAIVFNMDLREISLALQKFKLPPGRMNLIYGVCDSLIIDDSYNSSPYAACKALETLAEFKGRRKIAALGTMNELGDYEEKGHREVGKKAAGVADLLITVGKEARLFLAQEAYKSGLSRDKIFCFENSLQAGDFLKDKLKKEDIVLVKGSQNNVRMEWLVEKIMKNRQKAKDLLTRQGPEWDKPKELKLSV